MDNSDNRQGESGGAVQNPSGIYSTPDLTIDAQKIETSSAGDDRAKIASAFANTDASRQNERFNNMMNGMEVPQPATEDIRINNGPKKKMWPIVLALVAVIAVVGGVVAMGVVGNSNESVPRQTLGQAFSNYKDLVENGPEGFQKTDNSWFVMQLNNSDMTVAERENYVDSVLEKYNVVLDLVEKSSVTQDVKDYAISYYRALSSYVMSSNLSIYSQKVLKCFLDQGEASAHNYVNQLAAEGTGIASSIADLADAKIHDYLISDLQADKIYKEGGCIIHNTVDSLCVMDKFSGSIALSNINTDQEDALRDLEAYVPMLKDSLLSDTEALGNMIGVKNE